MLIDSYKNLVPTNNYNKPKYMGYLDAILSPIIHMGAIVETVGHAFDVQSARGEQLDIIGELVGISRLLPTPPTVGDRMMNDDEYLMCIMMKIAQNEWDGTNESAARLYNNVLGSRFNIYFTDNQNMSVDIIISGVNTVREGQILYLSNTLLVPAGVSYTVRFTDDKVNVSLKYAAGISGQLVDEPVNMITEPESYVVEDIEDMYVYNVERRTVDILQN